MDTVTIKFTYGMHAGQFRITEFAGSLQQIAIGSSDFHHTSAKMKFPCINNIENVFILLYYCLTGGHGW